MKAEKNMIYEIIGMAIIGVSLMAVVVGLFSLFSIDVKIPTIPNF